MNMTYLNMCFELSFCSQPAIPLPPNLKFSLLPSVNNFEEEGKERESEFTMTCIFPHSATLGQTICRIQKPIVHAGELLDRSEEDHFESNEYEVHQDRSNFLR